MSIKNLRILMDGPEVTSNRRLNLFSIIIPLLGAVFALFSIPFLAITNTIVMIFIVFFLLNAIGVGTGLHRFFCHHAFATSTPVHYILAILGTAACQGPIDRWVADHRRHHRFTDQLGDTHSPVFRGTKKPQRWSGFFHAHIRWMF